MSSRCTKESKYCNVIAATFSKNEIWQATKIKWLECMCDPFTLYISIAILLTDFHTIYRCIVWRVWCWINVEPPDWYFCYSHHLSAWYCIDIVRRNSVLITHGSLRLIAETTLHVLDILLISQSGFLLKKNTVHMNGWSRCKSKFFWNYAVSFSVECEKPCLWELIT